MSLHLIRLSVLALSLTACSGRSRQETDAGSGGASSDEGTPNNSGGASGGTTSSGGRNGDASGGNDDETSDGGAQTTGGDKGTASGGASAGGAESGAGGDPAPASGGMTATGGSEGVYSYPKCDPDLGQHDNPDCEAGMPCRYGYCAPPCENNLIDGIAGTGEECPAPETGNPGVYCGLSACWLRCFNGETCPDGMVCEGTPGSQSCVDPAILP